MAAAAAVALVVGAAVVLAPGEDGSERVTLPPAAADATPSPPEPSPEAQPTPDAEPSSSPLPSAAPTEDPDTPVSSAAEPSPQAPPPASAAPPRRSPAPPPSPAAPPPAPSPDAARADFGFDAAYGTDEPYEVVVQYGDSSSCPHEDVTHAVTESADRVVVTLTADAQDPARACTADYRQRLVPVRLSRPLGDRVLVDGSRDEPVAVDRSCSRPFPNPPPPKDCEP